MSEIFHPNLGALELPIFGEATRIFKMRYKISIIPIPKEGLVFTIGEYEDEYHYLNINRTVKYLIKPKRIFKIESLFGIEKREEVEFKRSPKIFVDEKGNLYFLFKVKGEHFIVRVENNVVENRSSIPTNLDFFIPREKWDSEGKHYWCIRRNDLRILERKVRKFLRNLINEEPYSLFKHNKRIKIL